MKVEDVVKKGVHGFKKANDWKNAFVLSRSVYCMGEFVVNVNMNVKT